MPFTSFIVSLIAFYLTSSVFLLASVRERRVRRPWPRAGSPEPARCARCAYALAGLPAAHPCPECGLPNPSRVVRRALVVHPFRLRQWRTLVLWFAVTILLSRPIAFAILLLAYRAAGFTASQTSWAIPQRELGPNGPGAIAQVWPLIAAAASLPIAALVLPPHRLRIGAALLLILGLAASVALVLLDRNSVIN